MIFVTLLLSKIYVHVINNYLSMYKKIHYITYMYINMNFEFFS